MRNRSKKTKELLPSLRVPAVQHTEPEVFIIETLSDEDEANRYFEGRLLSEILYLAGKNPKYYYFQSVEELPHLIGLFRASQYRYLHFSAHADNSSVSIGGESVSYQDLSKHFEGHLRNRRLFMSACETGNQGFAEAISGVNKGMYSIVAPMKPIQYDHAAAIWSAFYVSIFGEPENMKRGAIIKKFGALKILFPVEFFFAFYHADKDEWEYA